jgi:predicted transcriptional regulator
MSKIKSKLGLITCEKVSTKMLKLILCYAGKQILLAKQENYLQYIANNLNHMAIEVSSNTVKIKLQLFENQNQLKARYIFVIG